MIQLQSPRPLTDLTDNLDGFLTELKESTEPILLTVDGKVEFIVQDATAYHTMLDSLERLENKEAIREALNEADRGEGRPMEEFFEELLAEFETQAGS